MSLHRFFPTTIYKEKIDVQSKTVKELNQQLLKEIAHLQYEDVAGVEWSKKNYPNGFTSYASANQMHLASPTFAELESKIKKHLQKYIRSLELQTAAKHLRMSTCWVNIMPQGAFHTSHNHPQSLISGTYYVQMPEGSSAIKFEDPRYPLFMYRCAVKPQAQQHVYHSLDAVPGDLILFESWLRHEVPLNSTKKPRISISFNYS